MLTFAYKQISDSLQTADFCVVGCFGTHAIGKKEKKKKETVPAPVNVRAGHLHRFSIAAFFSHFVTLLLYMHIPSSKRLMWILTKLYGLFSPAPIEERPSIISVGAGFRQFGNWGKKCLSFK